MNEPKKPGIAEAVERLHGQTATRDFLAKHGFERITPQAVQGWLLRGFCPAKYAPLIEEHTGIPREYLIDPELQPLLVGLCD